MLGGQTLQAAICLSVELHVNNQFSEWVSARLFHHILCHGKATVVLLDSAYMLGRQTLQAAICRYVNLHATGTPPMQLQQQAESVLRCMLARQTAQAAICLPLNCTSRPQTPLGCSAMYDRHRPKGNDYWPLLLYCIAMHASIFMLGRQTFKLLSVLPVRLHAKGTAQCSCRVDAKHLPCMIITLGQHSTAQHTAPHSQQQQQQQQQQQTLLRTTILRCLRTCSPHPCYCYS